MSELPAMLYATQEEALQNTTPQYWRAVYRKFIGVTSDVFIVLDVEAIGEEDARRKLSNMFGHFVSQDDRRRWGWDDGPYLRNANLEVGL